MKANPKAKDSNVIIFNIIYISKKVIPQNHFSYFIFFLLKFLGILSIANIYIRKQNDDNDTIYIDSFLSHFTFYKLYEKSTYNYNMLCIFLYFLILLPLIGYYVLYKIKSGKKAHTFSLLNKRFIKSLAILSYIIFLFFQHITEILFSIYFHLVLYVLKDSGVVRQERISDIESFEAALIFKYIFLLLNGVFIIALNILFYQFIMLINEPFIDSKSTIKVFDNRNFIVFLIILTNSQAFCNYHNFFEVKVAQQFKLVLCITFLTINLIMQINFIRRFHYITFFKKFLIITLFYTSSACLLNIAIYHVYDKPLTNQIVYLNTILCFIFAILMTFLLIEIRKQRDLKSFANSLFLKIPKKIESYLSFTQELNECIYDPKKFIAIYEIINVHQQRCQNEECQCRELKIDGFCEKFIEFAKSSSLIHQEVIKNFKHHFEDIILLVENEIVNFIHYEYKGKDVTRSFNIFILHIDYIFHYRKNYLMVNFLIENYTNAIKNLPFTFKFYFFQFKKKVEKFYFSQLGVRNKNSILFGFYEYLNIIDNIKKLILKNVNDFLEFINIKKVYDMKKEISVINKFRENNNSGQSYNVSAVIDICENLQKHYKKIKQKIKKNFSKMPLKNIEMCYLITHFFININSGVPKNLSKYFFQTEHSKEFDLDDISTYKEKHFNHPIILQNIRDTFKIIFICQKLCQKLGYQKNRILKEDFEIFFPKQMGPQHTILMKKTLFLENNVIKLIKDSFVLTQDQHMLPCNILATSMPMLYQSTLIIIDIKIIRFKTDNYCSVYNIVLDNQLNMIAFTRQFFENFFAGIVTVDLLEKYNITFGNMFDINSEKLSATFEQALGFIRNVNLKNFNPLINIFQPIALRNTMNCTKDMKTVNKGLSIKFNNMPRLAEFSKNKSILKQTFERLSRLLFESNFDKESIQKVNNLYKKFLLQTSSNKLGPVENKITAKGSARKLVFVQNNVDSMQIEFSLLNMGNFPFYRVTLYDYELFYRSVNDLSNKLTFSLKSFSNKRGEGRKHASIGLKKPTFEYMAQLKSKLTPFKDSEYNVNQDVNTGAMDITPIMNFDKDNNLATSVIRTPHHHMTTSIEPILKNNNNNLFEANKNFSENKPSQMNLSLNLSLNLLRGNTSLNDTLGILLKGRKEELSKKQLAVVEKVSGGQDRRKPVKFNETILLTILIIATLILLFMILYSFVLCYDVLTHSIYYILLKINFATFTSSLINASNIVLSTCLIRNNNVTAILLDEKEHLLTGLLNIQVYSNLLPPLDNNDVIMKIFAPVEYKLLMDDWAMYSKNAALPDEISKLSYLMSLFTYQPQQANLNDFLPNARHSGQPTNTDKLISYIVENVFQTFLQITEDLDNLYNTNLNADASEKSEFYFIYDLIIILISLIVIILTLFVLKHFESKIGYLIYFIFINNRNDNRLEKKLKAFRKLVNDSDKHSFREYNKILVYNDKILSKFVSHGTNESTQMLNNFSLFNETEIDITNNNIENDEHIELPSFKIKLLKMAVIVIFLSLVVMIALGISCLLLGKREIDYIILSNNMISNYMNRLRNISQLILYFQISIISMNTRIVKFPQANYKNINNYFNIVENINADSVYLILDDSLYANIYYMLNSNRKNLQLFMNKDYKFLSSLDNLENIINSNQFCSYLLNSTLSSDDGITVEACLAYGNGINSLGFDKAVDNIVTDLSKLYMDFDQAKDKKPLDVLLNNDFIVSLTVNNYYFRLLNEISMNIIMDEVPQLYYDLSEIKLIFACLFLFVNLSVIIFALGFILPRLQQYFYSLQYALAKLKKASRK
jgi:hypothetical protein